MATIASLSAAFGIPFATGSSGILPTAPAAHSGQWVSQQQLIDATNRYRAAHGLPALAPKAELNAWAQEWSWSMARSDYLSHRPNLTDGYPAGWRYASENVLQNWSGADADALVAQWASSPGHRANMLDPTITHIGVGIADAGSGRRYATQNFARY